MIYKLLLWHHLREINVYNATIQNYVLISTILLEQKSISKVGPELIAGIFFVLTFLFGLQALN